MVGLTFPVIGEDSGLSLTCTFPRLHLPDVIAASDIDGHRASALPGEPREVVPPDFGLKKGSCMSLAIKFYLQSI